MTLQCICSGESNRLKLSIANGTDFTVPFLHFTYQTMPDIEKLQTKRRATGYNASVDKTLQGVDGLKVEIKIISDVKDPYAIIYASTITEELQRIVSSFEQPENVIIAYDENERIVILQPDEIFMVRIENSKLMIYCQNKKYYSRKRLYELGTALGNGFMQISKATLINLKSIDFVESSFGGMLNLKLKNGCTEYISRKYLPKFKNYLGL